MPPVSGGESQPDSGVANSRVTEACRRESPKSRGAVAEEAGALRFANGLALSSLLLVTWIYLILHYNLPELRSETV